MRFRMDHPTRKGGTAAYGFDRAIGFFVEVRERGGRIVEEYDRLHPPYDESQGAMRVLVEHGFFTAADLQEAARLVGALTSDEIEEAGVRRAARAIEDLRRAGDGW